MYPEWVSCTPNHIPTTESSSSLDQPHLATLKHLLWRLGSGLGAEPSFSSSCFWLVSISSLVPIQNKISHVFFRAESGCGYSIFAKTNLQKFQKPPLKKKGGKKNNTSVLQFFELLVPKKKTNQARSAWHQAPPNSLATRSLRTKMAWVSHWCGKNKRNDKMLFDTIQNI